MPPSIWFYEGYRYLSGDFEQFNERDLKTILLKCNDPHRRDGRPRKCRRLSVSPMNRILSKLPSIVTDISLVGNRTLGDAGMEHLHLLPTTLHYLDLSDCGLSSTGVRKICEYMATNTNIIRLLIWGNDIGDDGAEYVADMLFRNQTLRSLCIMQGSIGPNGFHHISQGLTHNGTLRFIYLGNDNDVGDDHMRMLSPGLAVNEGLEELELGNNSVTNQGLGHIEAALRQNYYLKILNMNKPPRRRSVDTEPGTAWDKISLWTGLNSYGRALIQDQHVALSKWHEILMK